MSDKRYTDEFKVEAVKQFWIESGGVYGYRKIHQDLCELGEQCGKNRVARLMKQAGPALCKIPERRILQAGHVKEVFRIV